MKKSTSNFLLLFGGIAVGIFALYKIKKMKETQETQTINGVPRLDK